MCIYQPYGRVSEDRQQRRPQAVLPLLKHELDLGIRWSPARLFRTYS